MIYSSPILEPHNNTNGSHSLQYTDNYQSHAKNPIGQRLREYWPAARGGLMVTASSPWTLSVAPCHLFWERKTEYENRGLWLGVQQARSCTYVSLDHNVNAKFLKVFSHGWMRRRGLFATTSAKSICQSHIVLPFEMIFEQSLCSDLCSKKGHYVLLGWIPLVQDMVSHVLCVTGTVVHFNIVTVTNSSVYETIL